MAGEHIQGYGYDDNGSPWHTYWGYYTLDPCLKQPAVLTAWNQCWQLNGLRCLSPAVKATVPKDMIAPSVTLSAIDESATSVRVEIRWVLAVGHAGAIRLMWPDGTAALTEVISVAADTPQPIVRSVGKPAEERILRGSITDCTTNYDDVEIKPFSGCPFIPAPVLPETGNMSYSDSDPLPFGSDFPLIRMYDSLDTAASARSFGAGWYSIFDAGITFFSETNATLATLTTDTNEIYTFISLYGATVFEQFYPKTGGHRVFYFQNGTYTLRDGDGKFERSYQQQADGRYHIVALRDLSSGHELDMAYDAAGMPVSITDNWGMWNYTVETANGHVTAIRNGGTSGFAYTYVGSDLTQIAWSSGPGDPGTQWRAYAYDGAHHLATVRGPIASGDPYGDIIEEHTYDASGRALSSISAAGAFTSIQYFTNNDTNGNPIEIETTVVNEVTPLDGFTTYRSRFRGGRIRGVQTDEPCNCSAATLRSYDEFGNIQREQMPDGYIRVSTWTQDGRRLVQREDGYQPGGCDPGVAQDHCRLTTDTLPTATLEMSGAYVKTSFGYGGEPWPDKPISIASTSVVDPQQSRSESFVYDAYGRISTHTTTGLTGSPATTQSRTTSTAHYNGTETEAFDPGTWFPSAWKLLSQPREAIKSIDGPRTDISDVELFVYYPTDVSVTPATLRGRLAARKNALGQVTLYESYDAFGNLEKLTDPNGVVTEWTHDALGRVLTETVKGVAGCDTSADPLCNTDLTTTYAYYSATGPLKDVVKPGGGLTRTEYGGRGRVAYVSRGSSAASLQERIGYLYDGNSSRKLKETVCAKENGSWVSKRETQFWYDTDGRVFRTFREPFASPLDSGTYEQVLYDLSGRISEVKDERSSVSNTKYAYDSMGRLAEVRQLADAVGDQWISTTYTYDPAGNLRTVTDPKRATTSYTADDFGQTIQQDSPVTGTTTYTFDLAGNNVSTTDARGATTTRQYDAMNRPTSATATLGTNSETTTWRYDDYSSGSSPFAIGRLTQVTDPTGSTVYSYDRRGNRLHEAITTNFPYDVYYRYDADGNRNGITYPSASLVAYTYDYAGRPLTATSPTFNLTYVSSASYLPFGPLATIQYGNGTTRTMAYDRRYRPQSLTLTAGGTTRLSLGYGTDANGNITAITDNLRGGNAGRTFGYDDLNRLTTANADALWGNGAYTYDDGGNTLTLTLGTKTKSFEYDGTTSKIAAVTENGVRRTVGYDAAGNQTTYFNTNTYSPRNQLTDVSYGTNHLYLFKYHAGGVRTIAEWNYQWEPQTYFYTPEMNLLSFTKQRMPGTSRPDMNEDIVWFAGMPVGQKFIAVNNGSTRWTVPDHLGTPLLQTDGAGNVVWRAEYEPYGQVWSMTTGNRTDQPLRFPGQEDSYDENGNAVYYNIFRWYGAGWGRYTQGDPLDRTPNQFAPAARREPRVSNGFVYANDDPAANVDRLGLSSCNGSCPECSSGTWAYTDESGSYGWVIWGKVAGKVTYFCTDSDVRCFFRYKCKAVGVQAGVWGTLDIGFVRGKDCKCKEALADSFINGTPWTLTILAGQMNAPCTGIGLSGTAGASFASTQTDCEGSQLECKRWPSF